MKELPEHFLEKLDRENGTECWLWTGSVNNRGYGSYGEPGQKFVGAHRYAYSTAVGQIPEGMDVMHTCDVRRCCNPAHLRTGSRKDNMQDCLAKGRMSTGDKHRQALISRNFQYDAEHARRTQENVPKGEKHPLSKLNNQTVHEIRYGKYRELTQKEVGRILGVSQGLVCMIRRRKIWKDVP